MTTKTSDPTITDGTFRPHQNAVTNLPIGSVVAAGTRTPKGHPGDFCPGAVARVCALEYLIGGFVTCRVSVVSDDPTLASGERKRANPLTLDDLVSLDAEKIALEDDRFRVSVPARRYSQLANILKPTIVTIHILLKFQHHWSVVGGRLIIP